MKRKTDEGGAPKTVGKRPKPPKEEEEEGDDLINCKKSRVETRLDENDDDYDGGGRRGRLLEEYKHLTNVLLPAEARKHTGTPARWPIRLNHCFQRVILDNLFEGVWYPHLDGGGTKSAKGGGGAAAMHRLRSDQLEAALAIGQRTLQGGAPAVRDLNERSLAWRGKQRGRGRGRGGSRD